MELIYVDGSPFSRIVRVLIAAWGLPVALREVGFPLPKAVDALTPMGQVPLLLRGDAPPIFPTLLIIEHLAAMAPKGAPFPITGERARLVVALTAGDALAQAAYIGWAGLGPVGPNVLGFDLRDRLVRRFNGVAGWLAQQAPPDTVTGLALAVLLDWARSRGVEGVAAEAPALRDILELLERPEVAATAPRPYAP